MTFLSGIDLSRRFYAEAVAPAVDGPHSAALVGPGSEVLGFDTARSADHDWTARVFLFLPEPREPRVPATFLGHPVKLVVATLDGWARDFLGFDPLHPRPHDWLATPTQVFAEFTGGAVFHDDLGFETLRQRVAWYPDDVWRYVLACQWQRIGQEEAFVGRCGEVGDELGSAVVAARLVRDLMRLCLLMARRYPPYGKWFGSAFARLPAAVTLAPHLTGALAATTWRERERHLVAAYENVAELHNALGLTDRVNPRTRPFFDRPFQVIDAGRFVTPLLAGTPSANPVGAIDQFVDSTDALGHRALTRAVVDCVHG
ncbi:DUF4037 domain-containing protein [Amycolatopsis mongoliensis]|uniref:DUF4037 domain-containing protein n=1 Tax=Amycolatopsis mongoliensis TaxID=715475 RepID=A0A9Y2JYF2_9PSEU|nr:DUF4037 domain-containing protein [Amycolatopsis sp. 4-36]WIY07046.1 DUF4037 domain-containing protein [Amycolatopsis sp. 4-36]